MLNKKEILKKLRELKPALHHEYSVNKIGLFGSFVVDDAHENSDIDLLVELDKPIGWKYFSLELYLEKTFGRKVDLVTKAGLKPQLKERILKQVNYA